ncbi:hypothetical protein DCE79_02595 [Lysinibacillus sp. 2017]|uniref:hypothetical protein n=1 Tax=unclassified Lysinibacillus TaxID=2636778 RepID=UPI000D525D72|nr:MULTISPECIES: hypothetical protein [unclassified Lysinibacillus]AWE06340.1 hypothetical protein DCE79_02595 [Lysinibacillus sp. 2017]TGN35040.1 hypothetical protein E4L99_11805 [Lysinibacillus sp. S2017]
MKLENLVVQSGDRKASLSWNAVEGATSYNVYRSTTVDGTFAVVSNIDSLTYEDPGLEVTQTYYYYVTALKDVVEGPASEKVSIVTNLDQQGAIYTGDYVVISNESTDILTAETTGTLPTIMQQFSMSGGVDLPDYRENPLISFEPIKEPEQDLSFDMTNEIQSEILYVGSSRLFKVKDRRNNTTSEIPAVLLYNGEKAQIWVHDGVISQAQATQLGSEFDNNIYQKIVDNFGAPSDVNNDGKIAILTFDIQDGYTDAGSGGYIGGYFNPNDLLNTSYTDNYMEIFYIDTYPTMGKDENNLDVTKAYSTLAHEFQHMVNFSQDIIEGNIYTNSVNPKMDTWLNEGLSMAAETLVYNQKVNEDRVNYYNNPYTTAIHDGRSLLNWDSKNDTLANYSLSFLFLQYLKIQAGKGNAIFQEIIQHEKGNYEAVEAIIKEHIDPNMSFGEFMTAFRIALVFKEDTGLYGFKGDSVLNQIQPQLSTGGTKNLQGGGAIVVQPSKAGVDSTGKGENIHYTGIYTKEN